MEEKNILTALGDAFPGDILEAGISLDLPVVRIKASALFRLASFLKAEPWAYAMLLDATCVDYPDRPERFEMVYHFFSLSRNVRLRVKAGLPGEEPEIASLSPLWKNADWLEREIYDMFGVRFTGHPGLRRLLMYEGFEGHPLRRDYPLRKRQPILPERDAK